MLSTAFDKKWIGSLPRAKVEALRRAFKTVLENNSKAKRAAEAKQDAICSAEAATPPKALSTGPVTPHDKGGIEDSDVLSHEEELQRSSKVSKRATLQTSLDIE